LKYSSQAEAQVDELRRHYQRKNRIEAVRNLITALAAAESMIERRPGAGLAAPRPYPELAQPGRAWIKSGRYWVTYSLTTPPVILAVFFETADMGGRGAVTTEGDFA
jgi:plasmid stabilization system protein ParE